MSTKMRALTLPIGTSQMAIVDAEKPSPRRGEVLVEVKVCAVNEMDVESRAGGWKKHVKRFRKKGPVVSGFEFAGVASSGGRRIKAGDRVIGYVHVLDGPRTHAQYVCVRESCLQTIPDRMAFDEAAALVAMGLTAIEILERLKPLSRGKKILIIGAAGGVGVYALQLAKFQGAHATAICSQGNVEWIKSMGADETRVRREGANLLAGDRFDLIVDIPCVASFATMARFLAPGGMYVCTNPMRDLTGFLRALFSSRAAGFLMMLTTNPKKLKRLIDLVERGAIRPAIDGQFTLDQANQAFDRFVSRGKRGRVLLRVSP